MGKIYLYMGQYKPSSYYLWKVHSINKYHGEIKQYVHIMKMRMNQCLVKANENIIKGKYDMGILWASKGIIYL
jgi:hypothetical protein